MTATPLPVAHQLVAAAHVHADVRLGPALVGKAILRVRLTDDRGKPVRDAAVGANIDMASMVMDPRVQRMTPGPDGTYTETVTLTMPGHWRIELHVKRPGRPAQIIDAPVFIDLP